MDLYHDVRRGGLPGPVLQAGACLGLVETGARPGTLQTGARPGLVETGACPELVQIGVRPGLVQIGVELYYQPDNLTTMCGLSRPEI